MKHLEDMVSEPAVDAQGVHINVLEFVAIIINLWLLIVLSWHHSEPVGGHVFAVFFLEHICFDLVTLCLTISLTSHVLPCSIYFCAPFCIGLSGQGSRVSPFGETQLRSRHAILLLHLSNVGLCYSAMLPPLKLHHIPNTTQTAFAAWFDDFR
jgi:hypothetical protein